jgi:hypothetical protein
MKKSILFTSLIIALFAVITSCTPEPGPQPQNSPPTPTNNPPDLTTDDGIAAHLIGEWVLDSVSTYNNDIWTSNTPYPAYHLIFTSTAYDNTPGSKKKIYSFGVPGGTFQAKGWELSAFYFQQTGKHYLVHEGPSFPGYFYSITLNTMVIGTSSSNLKQGTYYFYTKIQ